MRVLVTGVAGFVGRHLTTELRAHGHDVIGFDLATPPAEDGLAAFSAGDIRNADSVGEAVARHLPEACVHLAGTAFVPAGQSAPRSMMDINLMGTLHVLEALRTARPACRLLMVSSAHVYGPGPDGQPVTEYTPLAPDSFYATSKAAADITARLYAAQYGMPVVVARPCNHIGPGQSPLFAVASFARQVKAIAAGADPLIKVGNLESTRDFTDVRDVTRAYRLLLEGGRTGEAYNIASGRRVSLADILQTLCTLAGVAPRIECDPARYRPGDAAPRIDTTRLATDCGWVPRIALEQTLRDILAAA